MERRRKGIATDPHRQTQTERLSLTEPAEKMEKRRLAQNIAAAVNEKAKATWLFI